MYINSSNSKWLLLVDYLWVISHYEFYSISDSLLFNNCCVYYNVICYGWYENLLIILMISDAASLLGK